MICLSYLLASAFSILLVSADALSNGVLTQNDIQKIARGGVAIIPDFIPDELVSALRKDARFLFNNGDFQPDGLTNTAKSKEQQGFTGKADRQTFRGGADWESDVGNLTARKEFKNRMTKLREQLAIELDRPSLETDGENKHEMTFNWYEPGAKLGRHLDEHHEETKGVKGWLLGTRRSVTWLVYLNSDWEEKDGGALRCFPREGMSTQPVGCHEHNLQIGWLDDLEPIYLDCFRKSGMSALYRVVDGKRELITKKEFDVPRQPIEFVKFLPDELKERFEQISTARLDPRFAASNDGKECEATQASLLPDRAEKYFIDVLPKAGTLVLFDSVSLPHLVREVTSSRQRIAATGGFHEDSDFFLEA